MRELIRQVIDYVFPSTGRHRTSTAVSTAPPPRDDDTLCLRLPRGFAPLDGDATPMVRPYVVEAEQAARRKALALALEGIDIGPLIIHGRAVPAC